MNVMQQRRAALADKIRLILKTFDDDYRVHEEFNRETFISTSRAKRNEVMGERMTYAEVLYQPATATNATAGATWTNKRHRFLVRVWLGFSDQSQDMWDDITEGEAGLLVGLEQTPRLDGFTLFNPTEPMQLIRVMDGKGHDLAHYLEFFIELR